jgi:hypothetical protein
MIRGSLVLELRTLRGVLPHFFEAEARRASVDMAVEVRKRTPIGRIIDQRTGADLGPNGDLRRSVLPMVPVKLGNDQWSSGAYSDLYYAPYVEYGTRPHAIVASPGKVLHFWSGGVSVFAGRVLHPGFFGKHMFLQGALAMERKYARDADYRLQAQLNAIFRGP